MYRHDPNPQFWAPVNVAEPGDGGAVDTFKARFRVLAVSRFNQLDVSRADGAQAFLLEALTDIDDVEDVDGKKMAFSDAAVSTLIDTPHVRAALVHAYLQSFRTAQAKN